MTPLKEEIEPQQSTQLWDRGHRKHTLQRKGTPVFPSIAVLNAMLRGRPQKLRNWRQCLNKWMNYTIVYSSSLWMGPRLRLFIRLIVVRWFVYRWFVCLFVVHHWEKISVEKISLDCSFWRCVCIREAAGDEAQKTQMRLFILFTQKSKYWKNIHLANKRL